jgi:hypothetical protein
MSNTTRISAALAAGALLLSLVGAPAPAVATRPGGEPIAELLAVFPDLRNGMVGYLNVTRADWCAWEASGFDGPAPLIEAFSPTWVHTTGTGQVRGRARDDLHLELWRLDDDAELTSSCEDTSDATEVFATGSADVTAADLSFDTGGHGAYVADMTIRATLDGTDGHAYHYRLHVISLVDPNGVVRHGDTAHMTLNRIG